MTSRPSTAAPIVAAILFVLVLLLGTYVGGYFSLGKIMGRCTISDGTSQSGDDPLVETGRLVEITRVFPVKWQVAIYRPAAVIETLTRRIQIVVADSNTWGESLRDAAAKDSLMHGADTWEASLQNES